MHYVYAIYNKTTDKIYIGETSDPARRVIEHNLKSGNHYTAKQSGTWVIIYQEELPNRSDTLIREKQLKSHKGRQFIREFVNNYTSGSIRE